MRILVVGSSGFIGSHLCTVLTLKGHDVEGLVRPGLDDYPSLVQTLTGIEVVIYCAWVGHPRNDVEQIDNNVIPALRLATAAGEAGVSHVVFVSSGGGLSANTSYAYGKKAVEGLFETAAAEFGFNLTVLRPTAIYGPRQDPSKGLGVVATFLDSIRKGHLVQIYGSPDYGRDFLHVIDFSECVSAVIDSKVFGTFEVGGPEIITLVQLVEMIEKTLSCRANVQIDNPTGLDPPTVCLDNYAITAATSWIPIRQLEEELTRL